MVGEMFTTFTMSTLCTTSLRSCRNEDRRRRVKSPRFPKSLASAMQGNKAELVVGVGLVSILIEHEGDLMETADLIERDQPTCSQVDKNNNRRFSNLAS